MTQGNKPRSPKTGRTPPSVGTLVLISGVSAMVMNIFAVSLPKMSAEFGVSYAKVQIAITGYLFATALVQLFLGPLSDRYGRRPLALIGFGVFVLASLGASMAQSFYVFMMFRILQASVVTGFVVSRASIRDVMAGREAASRIAYVTMGMSLVPMLAPMFGGFLDTVAGWRMTFLFMAFAGAIVVIAVYFDMGETKHNRATSMRAQFELYPDLLRSKRFWGYTLTLAFASGMFFSYLSAGPYLGANIYNLEGFRLGLYLGFAPLGYFFGNFISGRFATRLGVHRLIAVGLFTGFVGMSCALIPAFLGATHPLAFFGFTVFIGFGNGMVIPSANAGMLDARPDLAGSAAGLSGAVMTISGAGLAQMAGMLVERYQSVQTLIYVIILSSLFSILAYRWTVHVEHMREKEGK